MEKINTLNFQFADNPAELKKENSFIATIPINIKSKSQLLDVYSDKFKLPDYFGRNWDALDEVLKDFYWIGQKIIIIFHEGIPSGLNEKDLKIYLDILTDAVQVWRDSPREGFKPPQIMHELIVVFPSKCKKEIEKIIK